MRYLAIGTIVITLGIFLWPLLLQASRRLAEGFTEVWDDPSELDNDQHPLHSGEVESSSSSTKDK